MTEEKRAMKIKLKKLNEDYAVVVVDDVLQVGDGCTIEYYSDEQACTIIEIDPKGRYLKVQEDKAIRIDNNGMSDCQSHVFERNPKGAIHTFYKTRRKDFTFFTDTGRSTYNDYGCYLTLKNRRQYFDYSF